MIIFLDFDGVIVTERSNCGLFGLPTNFDPEAIDALNMLIKQTNADIVISSTWRHLFTFEELKTMLQDAGVRGKVIGITPKTESPFDYTRGEEISMWLQDNGNPTDFIIIDDFVKDIRELFPDENIIHVKDGWTKGGLKLEHIYPILNRGNIT